MKKNANYTDIANGVDSLLAMVAGSPMGKSAGEREATDEQTSHPTGSAPDGTQAPTEGARSKENDADLNDAIDHNVNGAPAYKDGSPDSASTAGQEIDRVGENVPGTQSHAEDTDSGTSTPLDVSTEKTAFTMDGFRALEKSKGRVKAAADISDSMAGYLDFAMGKRAAAGRAPAQQMTHEQQESYAAGQQYGLQLKQAAEQITMHKAAAYQAEAIEDARLYTSFCLGLVKKAADEAAEMMAAEGGAPMEGGQLPPEDVGALLEAAGAGGEGGGAPMPAGEAMGMPAGDPAAEGAAGIASEDELAAALMAAIESAGITPEELVELAGASEAPEAPLAEKAARLTKWKYAAHAVNNYAARARVKKASVHTNTAHYIQNASNYLADIQRMQKLAAYYRQKR